MKKNQHYIAILLPFLCFFISLKAQSPLTNISDLPQLTDNPIHKIVTDNWGTLWLATQKGIYQYNGFECNETNTLIDSTLDICIIESQAFFCTAHSLYTFPAKYKKTTVQKIQDFPQKIKQILPYQKGIILAFEDSGMVYVAKNAPYNKLISKEINLNIHHICLWQNKLLAGNYEGLFEISQKDKNWVQKPFLDSLFYQKAIKSFYNFEDSLLFILDYNGNITVLDAKNDIQYLLKIPEPVPLIKGLTFENQDIILFSDHEILRYYLDSKLWLRKDINNLYENEEGLLTMEKDWEGNVWFGSKNKGLYRYGLLVEKIPTNEANPQIFAVYAPSSHEIWYANETGIFRLTWQNGLPISQKISLQSSKKIVATYITGDAKGNIWIGTFDNGLYICNKEATHIQHFTTKNGILNDNILHIFFHKERVWLSTFGGVSEGNNAAYTIGKSIDFQNYTQQNGFNSNYTYQVASNFAQNSLFFATEGKGCIQFSENVFKTIAAIPNNENVYSIFSDEGNNMFFLTEKDKLFWGQIPDLQVIDLSESGKKNFIFAHLDKNGDILLGYKEGLIVIEKDNWQFRDLGKSYLLGKIEPNMNSLAYLGEHGVLIGSNKGLLLYESAQKKRIHQANIFIENVEVELESIDIQKDSIFSYDENHFIFHFVGVWLTEPEKLKYRYKLIGLHQNWLETKDRFVNFAKLPAGKYAFVVQATIHHNFENAKEVVYTFYIKPPFWASNGFIVCAILSVIGIFFGIIRWREYSLNKTASIKKQQMEMELQVLKNQINPHFLFNSLNTLVGIIEESPKEAVYFVEHLSSFYRNILKYKEIDMISVKEEWNILQEYLYLLQTRFQDNITFDTQLKEADWEKKIPAFSLQMLMENAVKHNVISRSKPLHIRMWSDEEMFIFQNTYQPKQSILHSTGIGLKNINSRFELLTQRAIRIEQTATHFRVYLPLILPKE